MIIALAGRRIDAQDIEIPCFPLENCANVSQRISKTLLEQQATTLVSSAACGADLLALEAAGQLGIRRHVILPFSCAHFRAVSVTDRPGEWGTLFDQIIRDVAATGDLVLLDEKDNDTIAFIHTNRVILKEAQALAPQISSEKRTFLPQRIAAVIVWDGQLRGESDLTADFMHAALSCNIPTIEIKTL